MDKLTCLECHKKFEPQFEGDRVCYNLDCQNQYEKKRDAHMNFIAEGLHKGDYEHMTLESFEWNRLRGIVWDFNKQEETVEEFRKFISEYISEVPTTGLTLIGNFGAGKTHLSIAIVKVFIIKHYVYTNVRSFPLLLQELRESYDGQGISNVMNMYTTVPLLLIDEIGKEKISDWVSEMMFLLIDGRIKNRVPTIITSNESLEGLEEAYGGAVKSRLLQGSAVIQIRADDYRETIQTEIQGV